MDDNTRVPSEITPNQWTWNKKVDPPFHKKQYNANLVKYHDRVMGQDKLRVFVPLCGKTLDMIYLSERGHGVVGLEFSQIAIEDFFAENDLTYDSEKLDGKPFVRYAAREKNITIYQGDLFDLSSEVCGDFDASWDRGSFVAINVSTRAKYGRLMSDLIKPSGKILMELYQYDLAKCTGPPHYAEEKDLVENFTEFQVRMLSEFVVVDSPPYYSGDDFQLGVALLSH